MRMPNGSNIPSEIWDCVFMHCERVIEVDTTELEFLPNHPLHPLLLVCKEWHAIAERRLYTCVWLGSDTYEEDEYGFRSTKILAGEVACQRFCKTVQSNHRLASLVRELHLGAMSINVDETKLHIQLIKLCKNVESLDLCGCAHGFVDHLKAALEITNLVSFKLSVHDLTINPRGAKVFSIPQLFSFIQIWPRLEILDVDLGKDWGVIDEIKLEETPLVFTECAALRDVSISANPFKPKDLICLHEIAPALEKLTILSTVGMECTVVLQRCLNAWSSTLKVLDIWRGYDERCHRAAAPIFNSPMAELCGLAISMPMAPPSSLAYLPKLEWLTYYGEYEDGMELARVIEDDKLPSLRTIYVSLDAPWEAYARPPSRLTEDPPDETYLEVLLELHKVCGPKHIVVNSEWTLEELEQFVTERDPDPSVDGIDGSCEPEMPCNSDSDWNSDSDGSDWESHVTAAVVEHHLE